MFRAKPLPWCLLATQVIRWPAALFIIQVQVTRRMTSAADVTTVPPEFIILKHLVRGVVLLMYTYIKHSEPSIQPLWQQGETVREKATTARGHQWHCYVLSM
jgi:hypothetical protein